MAARRTGKQIAASRRNLVKARAKKKHGGVKQHTGIRGHFQRHGMKYAIGAQVIGGAALAHEIGSTIHKDYGLTRSRRMHLAKQKAHTRHVIYHGSHTLAIQQARRNTKGFHSSMFQANAARARVELRAKTRRRR